MKYNYDWLINELNQNKKFQYVGFWGNKNDSLAERSFSNFFKSPMNIEIYDGRRIKFECNEQYFMYRKALTFKDFVTLEKILVNGLKPNDYKELGRAVQNFDKKLWDSIRYDIMLEGLREKFTQNDTLKKYLLQTGDKIIVETTGFDTIWGNGHFKYLKNGQLNKDCFNPYKWTGTNLLGFALMELRDELNEQY